MKPVKIDNITYPSLKAAWREISPEGLTYITVYLRIRNNWAPKDALTIPVVPPHHRRGFPAYRILK